jgi:ferritin
MSVPNDELEEMVKHLNSKNKVVAKSFLSWLLEKQIEENDDILTPDEIKAIDQAREEYQAGEYYTLEEMKGYTDNVTG